MRIAFGLCQHARCVLHLMLSVGVQLQRMTKARGRGGAQSGNHRRSLTLIVRQRQHPELRRIQRSDVLFGPGIAAVVDHDHRQVERGQPRQHRRQHGTVVVAGNQHAGRKRGTQHRRIFPLLATSACAPRSSA